MYLVVGRVVGAGLRRRRGHVDHVQFEHAVSDFARHIDPQPIQHDRDVHRAPVFAGHGVDVDLVAERDEARLRFREIDHICGVRCLLAARPARLSSRVHVDADAEVSGRDRPAAVAIGQRERLRGKLLLKRAVASTTVLPPTGCPRPPRPPRCDPAGRRAGTGRSHAITKNAEHGSAPAPSARACGYCGAFARRRGAIGVEHRDSEFMMGTV